MQFFLQSFSFFRRNQAALLFLPQKMQHAFIQHAFRVFFPDYGKFLGGTACQRGTKHPGKGNVLQRIVAYLKIIQNRNHLKC